MQKIIIAIAVAFTVALTGCGQVKKWTHDPAADRWVLVAGERDGKEPFFCLISPTKDHAYVVPAAWQSWAASLEEGEVVNIPASYAGWKYLYLNDEEVTALYEGNKSGWEDPTKITFVPKFIYVDSITAVPSRARDSLKK